MTHILPRLSIAKALAFSAAFTASPALAFTLDCTSGTGSYNGVSSMVGEVILPPGGAVTVMQSSADSFTIRLDGRTFDASGGQSGTALACQNSPGGIFEVPYTKGQGDCSNWVFQPGDGGTYKVEPAHNETGLVKWTLTCGAEAAAPAGPTAQQIQVAQTNVTRATQLSASGQSASASSAVSGAIASRLGGTGGVSVSTQGFFLSTSGATGRFDNDWNGWVALGRRSFDGTGVSGGSTALTLGVDRKIGDRALIGLMLSGDDMSISQGVLQSSTRSFAGGPYFAAALGPVVVDGFVARGRTDVSGGLGNFSGTRTFGALNVKYSYDLGGWTITPFAGLRGYREQEPGRLVGIVPIAARDVTSLTASLGGTFAYEMSLRNQVVTPFITLAAEQTRFDNGFGVTSTNTAPRIALGLTSDGRLGSLSLSIDGGEVARGLRDYGVSVSYALRF